MMYFSYLPMCHITERLLVEMGSIYSGGKVYFVESIDTFSDNLSAVSPTVFLGVLEFGLSFNKEFYQNYLKRN